MTTGQKEALRIAYDHIFAVGEEMMKESPASYYLEVFTAGKSSVILTGNAHGFVRLAALLLELALDGKDGKHFRLSRGVLHNDDKELELHYTGFKAAPPLY
jgi:hypothetical protein